MMDGDNDMNEFSFIDLINDLASSRPDGISEDEREELVENAIDLLSNNLDNRRALADHTGAYHTSINKKLEPLCHLYLFQKR